MISSTLNIGSTGLRAAQAGLDVTSHNISNVHTPGYKRKELELEELTQNRSTPKQFNGMGVGVKNIKTISAPWLEDLLPKAVSDSENADKTNILLNGLNDILSNNDIDKALRGALNSFQEVANNPASVPIRDLALKSSNNLIDTFNSLNSNLNDFKSSLLKEKEFSLSDINNNIEKLAIAQKNKDINGVTTTVEELSKYMEISFNKDKSIISINGKAIAQNGKPSLMSMSDLDKVTTGSIGAINKSQNDDIPKLISNTNALMDNITTKINDTYKTGFDLDGNTGNNLFNISNGEYSLNTIDPRKIQVSSVSTPGVNDGTVAQDISELRNYKENNQTFFEQNQTIKNDIAFKLDQNKGTNDFLKNGLQNLKEQISSYSGVNLDEEGVNLLKYQRMYEANAKVIQVADSMIGTLLSIKT